MNEKSNESNRCSFMEPLPLKSGGARRVPIRTTDSIARDIDTPKRTSLKGNRVESVTVSRKRKLSGRATLDGSDNSKLLSPPNSSFQESPRRSLSGRSSMEKESLIPSLKFSSNSDLIMPPPKRERTVTEKHDNKNIIPHNLMDTINGKCYSKLNEIGKGGSSTVYMVMDEFNEILALKCVRLKDVPKEQCNDFVNEIEILKSLRGSPNIIQIIDSEVNTESQTLFILMECGETDLKSYMNQALLDNRELDTNFIRLMWQEMITAVNIIHERKIIHSDIKPANFLFVKGSLKLIDFGIATTLNTDATSVIRDNQVGTLNYISPEALSMFCSDKKEIKIRPSSDVWSLGCILYQMIYKQLPWQNLPLVSKMAAINQNSFDIPFPSLSNPWLLDVLRLCLQRDPMKRPSISGPEGLLLHPFLQPQGPWARRLYKQISLDSDVMYEVIKQIHEASRDKRWNMDGFVPMFAKEVMTQCAQNKPINVIEAMNIAERKCFV